MRGQRIELALRELERAVAPPLREHVRHAVLSAGFRFVALDLAGMQSGAFTMAAIDRND